MNSPQQFKSIRFCTVKTRDGPKRKSSNSFNRRNLGKAVEEVLANAKKEGRLIFGLLDTIQYLEKDPDDVLLCFLPDTNSGDAATHMQTVLLQAYCYENYVPVIQVKIKLLIPTWRLVKTDSGNEVNLNKITKCCVVFEKSKIM